MGRAEHPDDCTPVSGSRHGAIAPVWKSTRRGLRYLWAAPTSAVGLAAGLLALGSGGRVQTRQGALEFHGGFASWFLDHLAGASAMTLGHVILGRDTLCLDLCREHEQAHVRQVERWGPLFLPAYLACSAWEWSQRGKGRHYYYDNYFERQARRECGEDQIFGA
jgi:hypothetical protein